MMRVSSCRLIYSATALVMLLHTQTASARPMQRQLKLQVIAGYQPLGQVTDEAAIDLDQRLMEKLLGELTEASMAAAQRVYEEGAFSRSYAEVRLSESLPREVYSNEEFLGHSSTNQTVDTIALEPIKATSKTLKLEYVTYDEQANYVNCQVGANPEPNLEGCLASEGEVFFVDENITLSYSYHPATGNKNQRELQGLSKLANYKMKPCNACKYFHSFQSFVDFYGTPSYANAFIEAAFFEEETAVSNFVNDFSLVNMTGQAVAVRRATVVMSIAKIVIREMEMGFRHCNTAHETCSGDGCGITAAEAVDAAVAFYAGSLEGTKGTGEGVLMYALADEMCVDFGTCGLNADRTSGRAKVNYDIFGEFELMQESFNAVRCPAGRRNVDHVSRLINIPVVQGILRAAYRQSQMETRSHDEQAEGVMFTASLLPLISSCRASDALILGDMMRIGSSEVDFAAVKDILQRNYHCLGITCEDVGGYRHSKGYYEGAEPCVTEEPEIIESHWLRWTIVVAILGCAGYCTFRRTRPKRRRRRSEPGYSEEDDDYLSDDSSADGIYM